MVPVSYASFVQITVTYQHWRWKAAGQWSQHSKSPPSRQLSQVSWLVALPLLRTSLTNFRLLFSISSDFGGANSVWICCKKKVVQLFSKRSRLPCVFVCLQSEKIHSFVLAMPMHAKVLGAVTLPCGVHYQTRLSS